MSNKCRNCTNFALLVILLLPSSAISLPAITCHCFTDRSYDNARPAAADPYFLATTQNSFFAVVFNVDKKSIVMKKQQGTSSDDLWIAYWVASKSGINPDSLFKLKHRSNNWKDLIDSMAISNKKFGAKFSSALNSNSSDKQLAEAVVDQLFLNLKLLSEPDLISMRKAGIANQELIIATIISLKTGQPVGELCHEIKRGFKTWGSLLAGARIDTKKIQQEITAAILKK